MSSGGHGDNGDPSRTRFERIGGEAALRMIIDEFVDRVFGDLMIGFHFRNASRERIKKFEYQHAAEFLGAPGVTYEGQPLDVAHAKHPIMGGQFERRKKILEETLEKHGVDPDIVAAWLAHTESLRGQITGDPDSSCNMYGAQERVRRASDRGDGESGGASSSSG